MVQARVSFQYGNHSVLLETGVIARQATSAVLVTHGETVVLAAVVADRTDQPDRDFFPLTVDYQERTYAAGKIPGGFFKREGRPSEKETLTARLIDRPLRPLFPKGFRNEVQVICTVLSLDPTVDPDLTAMIGASAAVSISGIPFNGPIAAARVGYGEGAFMLNPSFGQLTNSDLNLVVAGTETSVLMVESEANRLSEAQMLAAVMFGHERMQVVIQAIKELRDKVKPVVWDWQRSEQDPDLLATIGGAFRERITQAYGIVDKLARRDALAKLRANAIESFVTEANGVQSAKVQEILDQIEYDVVRRRILNDKMRIDGRAVDQIRSISATVGFLPRTHGSALFTRGETQAIVVTALGTERDAQIVDAIEGERRDPFMLHYNFPPYCVGEVGRVGTPKRREIGHGRLAKRGILAVMPDLEKFPYVIRVVSEITESNGSSSMASVCGTSLSLMDAGVPIAAPVAGIAMGLVKDGDKYQVLSDILGDEDHLGDMDFKVAGTSDGITALQMDIKIDGITREIMEAALQQARTGRLHILAEMNKALATPRAEMSVHAPRIVTIKIDPEKIRDVIGKGGSMIRQITEATGATIDIDDDGTVKIASVDLSAGEEARKWVERITADVMVGEIYEGRVAKLMDFGAFVNILPGRDGLVHISQISNERVEKVSDKLKEGELVKVKVLEIDKQGRIRLSMKAIGS